MLFNVSIAVTHCTPAYGREPSSRRRKSIGLDPPVSTDSESLLILTYTSHPLNIKVSSTCNQIVSPPPSSRQIALRLISLTSLGSQTQSWSPWSPSPGVGSSQRSIGTVPGTGLGPQLGETPLDGSHIVLELRLEDRRLVQHTLETVLLDVFVGDLVVGDVSSVQVIPLPHSGNILLLLAGEGEVIGSPEAFQPAGDVGEGRVVFESGLGLFDTDRSVGDSFLDRLDVL